MLKNKLNDIALLQGQSQNDCLLGREMARMDKETLDAFTNAMMSNASAFQILQVLNEEGIDSFKITHLRDNRRLCFKSTKECPCIKEARND